jgi:electron transport complex protein RnfC
MPAKKAFIPRKVILPLLQHTGSPAEPIVSSGSIVSVGDIIAKPSGRVSAAIHASISGKVTKVSYSPTRLQPRTLSVTIEAQGGEDQEIKTLTPRRDPDTLSKEELLNIVEDAGIVGMGGAVFPAHVKLSPPATKPIDTVILNGAECEPYISCDHRLMLEKPKEILKGLEIIAKILGAKAAYVAIEDNKQSAIYVMEKAIQPPSRPRLVGRPRHKDNYTPVKVVPLHAKYPQGAEKQIIKALLDRDVPAGGLPMDVGCVVHNVATAYAIYEAVTAGKPLIERMVTVTGSCVMESLNIWVRIGTMLTDLVEHIGGLAKEPSRIIVGGPMMGIAQYTMDIPVTKGFGAVIFQSNEDIDLSPESVCIRCGRCVDSCPMGLVPTALMYRVKKENFGEAGDMGIANCYECGACAYTCPAKIPLLDYMKYGKYRAALI